MSDNKETSLYKAFLQPNPKVIYITETKEDAELFQASGYSAMAIETKSSELTEFINRHRSVVYVLAFNTCQNLQQFAGFFEGLEVKFYALLPVQETRWSDALQADNLKSHELSAAVLRGKLALATSAQEKAQLYYLEQGESAADTVLCFDQATYIIKIKGGVSKAQPLLNGTISPKYYLSYTRENGCIESHYVVEIAIKGVKTKTFKITLNELNTPRLFLQWLVQHRQFFHKGPSYRKDLAALADFIQSQPYVMVRKLNKLGFDPVSNCYVFPGFLYDENGRRHDVQNHGIFHTFALSPCHAPSSYQIVHEVDEKVAPERIIKHFYQAYGIQGIFELGAYSCSVFSHELFSAFHAFPLIEKTGNSSVQESAHLFLNRMFFLDFDGIPLQRQQTLDKLAKAVSYFSQWPVPFLENEEAILIKESALRPYYQRKAISTIQLTEPADTPDSLAIHAGVLFHRSFNSFSTHDMLACTVTIEYKPPVKDKLRLKDMSAYKSSQLAVVGHAILTHRNYFSQSIVKKTQQIKQCLIEGGVREDVALNHAMLAAGAELLIEKFKLGFIHPDELFDYTRYLSQHRSKQLTNRHPLADKFFDTLFSQIAIPDFNHMNRDDAEQAVFLTGAAIMGNKLVLALPVLFKSEPFKQLFSQGYAKKPPEFYNQLQLKPGYLMHNHRLRIARPSVGEKTKQLRYWVFDLTQLTALSSIKKSSLNEACVTESSCLT